LLRKNDRIKTRANEKEKNSGGHKRNYVLKIS